MAENSRICIKAGAIEVEYEGNQDFIVKGLLKVVEDICNLADSVPFIESNAAPNMQVNGNDTGGIAPPTNDQSSNLSTNAIATQYGAKTAADLVLCAVIQLQLIQRKDGCTRDEILAEMKAATNFYKKSMRGTNLGNAFASLSKKKKLNELHGGKYSLTATEKQGAEAQLAGTQ